MFKSLIVITDLMHLVLNITIYGYIFSHPLSPFMGFVILPLALISIWSLCFSLRGYLKRCYRHEQEQRKWNKAFCDKQSMLELQHSKSMCELKLCR